MGDMFSKEGTVKPVKVQDKIDPLRVINFIQDALCKLASLRIPGREVKISVPYPFGAYIDEVVLAVYGVHSHEFWKEWTPYSEHIRIEQDCPYMKIIVYWTRWCAANQPDTVIEIDIDDLTN